jgi:hypothetical protein
MPTHSLFILLVFAPVSGAKTAKSLEDLGLLRHGNT